MQAAAAYAKEFILWLWRCGRGWIELGHKVKALEEEVAAQATARAVDDDELRAALDAVRQDARASRERIHQRIDDLDRAQGDRMDAIDRAQRERIDSWAQQLTTQINQVLLAVASRDR
jgi:hypothetical protein